MSRVFVRGCALTVALAITMVTQPALAVTHHNLLSRVGPSIGGGMQLRVNGQSMNEMALAPAAQVNRVPLADGREVNLVLERFEVLTSDAQFVHMTAQGPVELPRPDVQLWRGTVAGEDGSAVFLALSRQVGINGYIISNGAIDIISSGRRGAQPPVIHRPAEVGGAALLAPLCHGAMLIPGMELPDPVREPTERATGPCRNYRIALDTDAEFAQTFFDGNGTDAQAYLTTLFGAVSEIYQRELNMRLQVPYIRTWETNDPWAGATTDVLLVQFMDEWNASMSGVQRDLAHLVVQRIRGGGIAYLGAMCTSFGYGVSTGMNGAFPYPLEDNNRNNWDLMVVAHELGHNFGTGHTFEDYNPRIDNCPIDCNINGQGTIMSYCHLCPGGLQNVRLTFGPRVISRIAAVAGTRTSCGTGLPKVLTGPTAVEVDESENITLTGSVDAIGGGEYRWLRNSVPITDTGRYQGTGTATLRINSATPSEAGTYSLRYTEACGTVTTPGAVVTVNPICQPNELAPTVTRHPIGTIVERGGTAMFSVAASSDRQISYQWRRNGNLLSNDGRISGTNTATLRIDRVVSSDAASYHCVVSASGCRASSTAASMTVLPTPGAFSLTSPGDDQREVSVPTIFAWTPSEDATSYIVSVDDDPSFASPMWQIETTQTLAEAPSDSILRGKRHYWRVTAHNQFGDAMSTQRNWSFVTDGPISDLNNDGVVDGRDLAIVLLRWDATCTLGPTMLCPDLSGDDRIGFPDLALMLSDLGFQRDDYTERQWKQQMKKLYKKAKPALPGRSSTQRRDDQNRLINVID